MNRPKYTIAAKTDHSVAVRYLKTKLLDPSWPSDDTKAQDYASRTFKKASRNSVTLTTWCDRHLDASQWTRLKGIIRMTRKRTRDLSRAEGKPRGVTLSHKAWLILHDLAEADKVTLSDWIEDRLTEEWNKLAG
jgi:macrodomain Ter protein organizer (MatP/YcbG family)